MASVRAYVYASPRRSVAGTVNPERTRAEESATRAAALRTALFTPTLRIYVSLRNVIPSRNDKINSRRRSLQIAARASTEFAEVPRKSAERIRAFELLSTVTGTRGMDEGGRRERLEGERIYLNILGNLGTRHALPE